MPTSAGAEACFASAFEAVAHVHRCMNRHDLASDLGRIEREAHVRAVKVDAATYCVLQAASELAAQSAAFDPTVARREGRGARWAGALDNKHGTEIGALILEGDGWVRALEPIALDLGGIAKGYAVDRAVEAMRRSGAVAGTVNAGGDLRVFGADHWTSIRVRHPYRPTLAFPLIEARECAVATSGAYFREGRSEIREPMSRAAVPLRGSVTVTAPTCMVADALTKVVALDSAGSADVLARYGAQAFRLEPEAQGLRCLTTCERDSANLRLPDRLVA